jgi:hypothetical protein
MMSFAIKANRPKLTVKQVSELEVVGYWHTDKILARRVKAVLLWAHGMPFAEIRKELNCCDAFIKRWVAEYEEGGLPAFMSLRSCEISRRAAIRRSACERRMLQNPRGKEPATVRIETTHLTCVVTGSIATVTIAIQN